MKYAVNVIQCSFISTLTQINVNEPLCTRGKKRQKKYSYLMINTCFQKEHHGIP